MNKKKKISLKKEVEIKSQKINLVEKIIMGFIFLKIFLEIRGFVTYGDWREVFNLTSIAPYRVIDGIFIPIALLIIIFYKFRAETKAKISFILGIFGLISALDYPLYHMIYLANPPLYSLHPWLIGFYNFFSYLISFYGFTSLQLMGILGLTYGIMGLKSSRKFFAWFGIIFSLLGIYALVRTILFILYFLTHPFAP